MKAKRMNIYTPSINITCYKIYQSLTTNQIMNRLWIDYDKNGNDVMIDGVGIVKKVDKHDSKHTLPQ